MIGAVFALIALLVAIAGIYGVLSYAVQSRTRELDIRATLARLEPQTTTPAALLACDYTIRSWFQELARISRPFTHPIAR